MKLRFYRCDICGKIITILADSGVPTHCCGQAMQELVPNKTDASFEKHVPVYTTVGNTVFVKIGSDPHPMTDSHSITWIGLRTANSFQFKELESGDLPEVSFLIDPEDEVEAVYAFCNLHGLWSSETPASVE